MDSALLQEETLASWSMETTMLFLSEVTLTKKSTKMSEDLILLL